jgi:putative tryptophan/tyrosine transport system substrate-binding protein
MLPQPLIAQQAPMPIIGILDSGAATTSKLLTFYEGLKVEGFSRNQNLSVEYHSAEGDYARLPGLAADLVDRRVTLITAFGSPAAQAAKAAAAKTPIVFAVSANPIEIGLVTSLNRPGANVTGVTGMAVGREHKRLELLHAAVPAIPVLGFLLNPQNSNRDLQINDGLTSAQKVCAQIRIIRASTRRDFGDVFAELTQSQAGGLVVADDEFFSQRQCRSWLLGGPASYSRDFPRHRFYRCRRSDELRYETDGALSPGRRL